MASKDELIEVFGEWYSDEIIHGPSEYFVILGHSEVNSIPMSLLEAKAWKKSLAAVFPTSPVNITGRNRGQHN